MKYNTIPSSLLLTQLHYRMEPFIINGHLQITDTTQQGMLIVFLFDTAT